MSSLLNVQREYGEHPIVVAVVARGEEGDGVVTWRGLQRDGQRAAKAIAADWGQQCQPTELRACREDLVGLPAFATACSHFEAHLLAGSVRR